MPFLRFIIVSALVWGCGTTNYTDPDGPRYFGSAPAGASLGEELTLITFNVKYAEEIDLAIEEILGAGLSDVDVILLQEMDAAGTERIADALSMSWVYYPASVHDHGRDFGNAVLSTWPIVADHKVVLPHGAPFDGRRRIAVAAELKRPAGRLVVYSVHNETVLLSLGARLEQAQAIIDDGDERYGDWDYVVMGGDYNTAGDDGRARTVASHVDAGFEAMIPPELETADNGIGGRALDHVFARGFSPLGHGLAPALGASDHRAVWVQLSAR